jgi:hypothetical protein
MHVIQMGIYVNMFIPKDVSNMPKRHGAVDITSASGLDDLGLNPASI